MPKILQWLVGIAAICVILGFGIYVMGPIMLASVLYGPSGSDQTQTRIVPPTGAPSVLDRLSRADGHLVSPTISFVEASGKTAELSDFRGRYVLLNLWATWCGPCIEELPALARLQKALPADRFAVVPVDVLEKLDAEKVGAFLKMHGADGLPVYTDNAYATQRGFTANELPLTVLIDSDGHEVARAAGGQKWDDPAAVAYLKAISSPPQKAD